MSAVIREEIDQPIASRLNASMTTAQYTLPSLVQCSVMSVNQSLLGCSARKLRFTRSSLVAALALPHFRLRFMLPAQPRSRMIRSTRFRPIRKPFAIVSSACIRGEPYVLKKAPSSWRSSLMTAAIRSSVC